MHAHFCYASCPLFSHDKRIRICTELASSTIKRSLHMHRFAQEPTHIHNESLDSAFSEWAHNRIIPRAWSQFLIRLVWCVSASGTAQNYVLSSARLPISTIVHAAGLQQNPFSSTLPNGKYTSAWETVPWFEPNGSRNATRARHRRRRRRIGVHRTICTSTPMNCEDAGTMCSNIRAPHNLTAALRLPHFFTSHPDPRCEA